MDGEATRAINGANNKMLARITGKSIHEDARSCYDLVRQIRARRSQYLVHILCMDPARMVHKTVQNMHENRVQGDLLMDSLSYSWPELVQLAANRNQWCNIVNALKGPSVNVTLGVLEEASGDFVCSMQISRVVGCARHQPHQHTVYAGSSHAGNNPTML